MRESIFGALVGDKMTKYDKLYNRRFILNTGIGVLTAATAILSQSGAMAKAFTIKSDIDAASLPASKTTPLGLYLSPQAAHKAIIKNPDILFVDVRDPIEITFVGHPAGLSKIIPLRTASHDIDRKTGQYIMVKNRNVLNEFDALLKEKSKTKSDPIFITCRSGSRSAVAARMLIAAGYLNVWNLTEGFEGDKSPDGSRSENGWRNARLPWGYKLGKGVAWKTNV